MGLKEYTVVRCTYVDFSRIDIDTELDSRRVQGRPVPVGITTNDLVSRSSNGRES